MHTIERLKEKALEIMQKKEQALFNLHQLLGAAAIIDQMISELHVSANEEKEDKDETKE